MARPPTRSSLETRLRILERAILQARNLLIDSGEDPDDVARYTRSCDLGLERWLQISDLIKILELDLLLKRSSRDGS